MEGLQAEKRVGGGRRSIEAHYSSQTRNMSNPSAVLSYEFSSLSLSGDILIGTEPGRVAV